MTNINIIKKIEKAFQSEIESLTIENIKLKKQIKELEKKDLNYFLNNNIQIA